MRRADLLTRIARISRMNKMAFGSGLLALAQEKERNRMGESIWPQMSQRDASLDADGYGWEELTAKGTKVEFWEREEGCRKFKVHPHTGTSNANFKLQNSIGKVPGPHTAGIREEG